MCSSDLIKSIVVYINKADLVEKDVLELVEMETRDLLNDFGFDGSEAPVIFGSALMALKGDPANKDNEYGEKSIFRLMEALDNYVPTVTRDYDSPFLLPVDNVFSVPGRGTVVVGTMRRGQVKRNDHCELVGFGTTLEAAVGDVHIFNQSVLVGKAGDNVGVLLRGMKVQNVVRGMMLCPPKTQQCHNHFFAKIYLLSRAEGGRKKPITSNYVQPFFSGTWNIPARLDMLEGVQMIMPGEHASVRVVLLKGMVLAVGQQFLIREGSKTVVATGIVTEVLQDIFVPRSQIGRASCRERV